MRWCRCFMTKRYSSHVIFFWFTTLIVDDSHHSFTPGLKSTCLPSPFYRRYRFYFSSFTRSDSVDLWQFAVFFSQLCIELLVRNRERRFVINVRRNLPLNTNIYTCCRFCTSLASFAISSRYLVFFYFALSALTLLVGRQEEHPACKNLVMRCWCGYLSGARCRLFAYGPADAAAIPKPHHLLPHLNPDRFYLSGTGLPRLFWKRGR